MRVRLERFRSCALVIDAVFVVDLQEQRIPRDDAEKHSTAVQADAAEHRPRHHLAQLLELIEDELPERVAHFERQEAFARARGRFHRRASLPPNRRGSHAESYIIAAFSPPSSLEGFPRAVRSRFLRETHALKIEI